MLLVVYALNAPSAGRAETLPPTPSRTSQNGMVPLQEKIDAAAPGVTILIPAGRYRGSLVLHQPIVLVADGEVVLDGASQSDVVRITSADVTLRGFRIRGTGDSVDEENAGIAISAPRATIENNVLEDVLFGIHLKNAHDTVLRGNVIGGKNLPIARRGDAIRLWNSHHTLIDHNTIHDSRDAVLWYSKNVRVVGNHIRRGRYGLHFMYSDDNILEDNHLSDNSVGAYLMYSRNVAVRRNTFTANRGPSGYGFGLKDVDVVVAEENTFSGNRVGVYIDNSPYSPDVLTTFRGNVLAYNDIGLAFQPAVRRNRFVENAFLENLEQIAVLSSGNFHGNEFTVGGRGNFWSDYTGYDLDGDGIGDLPYQPVSVFENLMEREPSLRMFLYSPAQQAVELAARAFPIVRLQPKFTDVAPLMQFVPAGGGMAAPRGWPLAAFGAGLVALAGLGLAMSGGRAVGPRAADARASGSTQACFEPKVQPSAGTAPLLQVAGLTKWFGRTKAVDELGFSVAAGEAVALWGPNGAGKTTAIKCILGLHKYQGTISVLGHDARRESKAVRRCVGYVSQELAFYDDLSARQVLQLFARLRQVRAARVDGVLGEVELHGHAGKPVRALSGGMKQRLALAAALLSDPALLLLDEPTSNLDAAARDAFLALLAKLKHAGKTMVFSTHRLGEVLHLADRVLILEHGRLVQACRPEQLMQTASLCSTLRIPLPAESREAAVRTLNDAGFTASANGQAILVRVAPHQKAVPLRVLAQAGIAVEDFEVASENADA